MKRSDNWTIRFHLDEHKRLRDRPCSTWASTACCGCDFVKTRIGDVTSGGSIRNRSTVIQQKTGRPVQFEIRGRACQHGLNGVTAPY